MIEKHFYKYIFIDKYKTPPEKAASRIVGEGSARVSRT